MGNESKSIVAAVVSEFAADRSRLLDIARAVQRQVGCLTEDTIAEIAQALGIHRAEVRDAVSFYAFLERAPVGEHMIRLCDAVVERMHGAGEVAAAFEAATGEVFGAPSKGGKFSLRYTACIGMSDQGPSALVDGVPLTHLRAREIPELIETLKRDIPAETLPQAVVEANLRQRGEVIFAPMERGAAIRAAVNKTPEEVIAEINKSRLRGRGGAGFPTAMKWDFCRKAQGKQHYLICNADEGEPGTFKDRVILSECPDLLFEGMTVAGYAIGAKAGFLYLRAEYEYLLESLELVLAKRRRLGLLGENICGREHFEFDIRIQLGAGAYICGEESALIESLEGKRGAPRDRPPFPVQKGYQDQPTSVNNVETLCCAARIIHMGGEWFSRIGTKDSTGTKLLSISGDCARPGVYEVPYGITVDGVIQLAGGGDPQAVQIGGPSGQCLAPKDFGRIIAFEDQPTGGSVIIFGPQRNLLEHMRQFIEFFIEESCGWCVPCRVGTRILHRQLQKVLARKATRSDLQEMARLCKTVKTMSRCGLGQTAANPISTTLQNFPQLYEGLLQPDAFIPPFDLEAALKVGCLAADRDFNGRMLEHE